MKLVQFFCFTMIVAVTGPVSGRSINVTEEEVIDLHSVMDVFVIDVRKSSEFIPENGIQGRINIPLNKLEDTFQILSPDEFEDKFNKPKPTFTSAIFITGRNAEQCQEALIILEDLQFTNVKIYPSGWNGQSDSENPQV